MKIWTISDLHLGGAVFNRTQQYVWRQVPDADVCVVAGDLTNGNIETSMLWLRTFIGVHMPVIYVAGNHDFYGDVMDRVLMAGKMAAAEHGIHFLEDEQITIAGTRFIGATLWTDYEVYVGDKGNVEQRERYMQAARRGLNDHRMIRFVDEDGPLFMPQHARDFHHGSRRKIREMLAQHHDGPTVVVTHHCPHPKSIADEFAGDALTPAFCSDLSDIIEEFQPELWIHGHTHSAFDYEVGDTRIVCNPRGYHWEHGDFEPEKVVDISRFGPKPTW